MIPLSQTSSTEACSVAPGADMTMAMTLIQMTVVGVPLLLALFQFINDHVYDDWDEQLTVKTQLFGGAMILSSFLLLYMYYAGLCTINNTLPPSRLTISISIFVLPLFIIISITLYAQFKQMVRPGLRFRAWMVSIGIAWGYIGFLVSLSGGSTRDMIVAYGLMLIFIAAGFMIPAPVNDDEPEWRGID